MRRPLGEGVHLAPGETAGAAGAVGGNPRGTHGEIQRRAARRATPITRKASPISSRKICSRTDDGRKNEKMKTCKKLLDREHRTV